MPHGQPPSGSFNRRIPLIPNSVPVKVRPYKYAHCHKSEIEHMVTQTLSKGIIELSNSPFSSPFLLVKKKDGSWQFCIDYRAFNAITIKDSFPIPIVDELLDELWEASYFSKLDLRSGYHQILLKHEDKYKMAFRTHPGHFQWNIPRSYESSASLCTKKICPHFFIIY